MIVCSMARYTHPYHMGEGSLGGLCACVRAYAQCHEREREREIQSTAVMPFPCLGMHYYGMHVLQGDLGPVILSV